MDYSDRSSFTRYPPIGPHIAAYCRVQEIIAYHADGTTPCFETLQPIGYWTGDLESFKDALDYGLRRAGFSYNERPELMAGIVFYRVELLEKLE